MFGSAAAIPASLLGNRLAANGFASGSANCDAGATLEPSDSLF